MVFDEVLPEREQRTKLWEVRAKADGSALGGVRWSTGWRRYVFVANAQDPQFDAACLRDIADFVAARTEERKREWSLGRARLEDGHVVGAGHA
jgi:hypothetical protein